MQLSVPSIAAAAALVTAGVIAVTPAAPALPAIQLPAVQLTADGSTLDTPTDLLTSADANLTQGVDGLVQELVKQPTNDVLAQAVASQDSALHQIGQLQSAEDIISAHDGSFSGLVNELFSALNQEWDQASEAVLHADDALDAAISSNSGIAAAQLGLVAADFQLVTPLYDSLGVDIAAIFFGGALTP